MDLFAPVYATNSSPIIAEKPRNFVSRASSLQSRNIFQFAEQKTQCAIYRVCKLPVSVSVSVSVSSAEKVISARKPLSASREITMTFRR